MRPRLLRRGILTIVLFGFISLAASGVQAIAAGGGSDGGCCGGIVERVLRIFPSDNRDDALEIRQWLQVQDRETLSFLSITANICEHMECLGLNPGLIARLAEAVFTERVSYEANRINWLIAGGTILSALIGLIGVVLGFISERRSRENQQKLQIMERAKVPSS